ncbi:metal ABC transporter solute-binding protein, Zn/Mn family [Alkalitalea saponilacus]|uniref:Zinc transport system substrate-binding protein n=1 Tax=Alkalitalea saponilacus TaxID=889453 RepID=A0A1T5A5R3_9BACT|nr:zinc ABC transporter substrate-binding protein [Alkalitalea saponilacus]ASB48839.1 zinc ABC transporter substrate-binding protein [Alkalitalea saponilacus]SKB30278.1 zinc transport system substrate-binding protein [Alkalitalea saponilacus]
MKNKILLIILAGFLMAGCKTERTADVVSVSILPQKFFIDQLTGESLDVNVMIPPGASHATYSPTPQQYRKLSDSRLYLGIGHLGYEQAWTPRLKELNPEMALFTLSDLVEPIYGTCDHSHDHGHHHHHHHGVDPHIWLSPKVMLELLPHIKEALMEAYPELSETISNNYPQLYSRVESIHHEMEQVAASVTQRSFMIFHPALTYLARDYGLEQVSIEVDGKEPSPAMLASTISQAKAKSIPVIFIQEEYDIRNAKMVSESTGMKVAQINPLAYDWVESMQHIMNLFRKHL